MSAKLNPKFADVGDDETDAWIRIGRAELVIHQRYEFISIVNDVMMALWFLVGSIMFFSPSWVYTATWCFTIGSAQFLIRPMIRLSRSLHLKRIPASGFDM